ncbi:MAG: hypothetical protein KF860_17140 [Cyclobacteriaceae bacterium]|nr:hypothetical protein [Cyclobacteriaceae bacterium]
MELWRRKTGKSAGRNILTLATIAALAVAQFKDLEQDCGDHRFHRPNPKEIIARASAKKWRIQEFKQCPLGTTEKYPSVQSSQTGAQSIC